MILVIDDDPRRLARFRRAFGKIQCARSYGGSLALLATYPRNKPTIYLDCDGVEGERIAQWLADTLHLHDAKIIIHSSNYVGAKKMHDTLAAEGYDVEMKSFAEIVG